jgi:hypothetical protein
MLLGSFNASIPGALFPFGHPRNLPESAILCLVTVLKNKAAGDPPPVLPPSVAAVSCPPMQRLPTA